MTAELEDISMKAERVACSALAGAVFPLYREELIWIARENGAQPELLTWLSQLSAHAFYSAESVRDALVAAVTHRDAEVPLSL